MQTVLELLRFVDDQDGAGEVRDRRRGDGAREVADQAAALVGADYDQAAGVLLGDLHQALPGRRRLDRQRLRAEARLRRQLGAVGGGFLRRLLDLVGRRRV